VENYVITDTFPPEFVFEQWQHSSPFDAPLGFTVDYTTTSNATFTAWPGTFSTGDTGASSRHDVSELSLGASEYVTALRFTFTNIPAGLDYIFATGANINILGDITTIHKNGFAQDVNGATVSIGANFCNTATLDTTSGSFPAGQYPLLTSKAITDVIADEAVFGLRKNFTSPSPYFPGEIIEVRLDLRSPVINVNDLVNPTIWDLLPPEMEYVGPIRTEAITGGDPTPSIPNFEAVGNWNGTGRTLLKFSWDSSNPYTITPNTRSTGGRIFFNVQVPFGTADSPPTFQNEVSGTLENPHICQNINISNIDTNDFDQDGDSTETFCGSRPANFEVFDDGSGVGLNSQKWVIGECDLAFSRFPDTGSTVPGGRADYELRISNPSSVAVHNISVIDILPHIGDTGVVDTTPRLTEWEPSLSGPVTFDGGSLPAGISGITVYYSTSKNPDRSEINHTVAGSDDVATTAWTTTPPTDITTVKSLRFQIAGTLNPAESLVIGWPMRAPLDAPTDGEIAWNSFGFTAETILGDPASRLLATEPVKVGFATKEQSPARYGDYVWFDTNRNGIQDPSESGIDGVAVELYTPSGGTPDPDTDTLVKSTITQNGGGYIFSELTAGDYYAVFYPPTGFTASTADQGISDAIDSDGIAGTVGVTPVLITPITSLSTLESDLTWDQGFHDPTSGITIGDYVWVDTILNDVQDGSELGLSGITVKLIDNDNGNTEIGSTVTDANGLYIFGGPTNENLTVGNNNVSDSQNIFIGASLDDAVQLLTGGGVNSGASNLDLGQRDTNDNNTSNAAATPAGEQVVGLRFNGVNIPVGATITNAYIQFSANNVTGNAATQNRLLNGTGNPATSLTIYGEAATNPGNFNNGANGPNNRTRTGDSATWVPATWTTGGERGTAQQTPSLVDVIDEIITLPGWASGNSLVILVEGTGTREVESWDDIPGSAAELVLEWDVTSTAQNTITTGTNYSVCIDTTQPALSSYSLVTPNSGGDTVDSDATQVGDDAVISYVGEADGTFNMTLDFGFAGPALKADFAAWFTTNSTVLNLDDNSPPGVPGFLPGGTDTNADDQAAFSDNPEGDAMNNLLEYALCFDPGTGLKIFPDGSTNEGFHLDFTGGVLDAKFTQPTGIQDVTYQLQSSTDGQTWNNATGVTSASNDNGDGTTTVCYQDLINSIGNKALLRLVVDADIGGITGTGITGAVAYQMATVKDFCQTYSDPALTPCIFTGTIDSVSGQIVTLTTSVGTGDLTTELSGATSYYMEMVSGDHIGHIFDISSFTATTITLAIDADLCALAAPFSSRTDVPATLAGDEIVIRAHKTLGELFPIDNPATTPAVEGFATGANMEVAGKLLRYDRSTGGISVYYATPDENWTAVIGGTTATDLVLPPGEGIFVHNLTGQADYSILQMGEARVTQLAVPLKAGYNFIAPGHAVVDQSIDSGTTNSRLMNADNSGGKFTFTGSGARSRADQLQLWRDDDAANLAATHLCYDLVFYLLGGASIDQWSNGGEASPAPRESEALFKCTRSMFYCIYQTDKLDYYLPSPISNN